ncbi:MAG: hypothetical protein ABIJ16_05275 [Bacteroidota bacterium]
MKHNFSYFLLFYSILILSACTGSRKQVIDDIMEPSVFEDTKMGEYTGTGKIVKIQFVDKGGRPVEGVYDLYIEFDGKQYFIKTSGSKYTFNELLEYEGKEINCKININRGLWDTDDPNVQSRVGNYAVIMEILN